MLQRVQEAVQQLARQVGGLSETVGGDIEDIAYIVLYGALKRELGWEVGELERTWQQWNGEPEEINIFGRATDPTHLDRMIWIVGEAKHNLTLREAEQYAQQVERARQHVAGRCTPSVLPIEPGQRCARGCRSWGFHCSSPMAASPKVLTQIGGQASGLIYAPCRRNWLTVSNHIRSSTAPTWRFCPPYRWMMADG